MSEYDREKDPMLRDAGYGPAPLERPAAPTSPLRLEPSEPTNEFLWYVTHDGLGAYSVYEPAGVIAGNLPKDVAELIVSTHNQEIEAFCRATLTPVPVVAAPTTEELMKFLQDEGWHIGDGVDDCAGWDEDEMKDSAESIRSFILTPRATTPSPVSTDETTGLRKRIHFLERHNQYFERCESAWCHPTEKDNPAIGVMNGLQVGQMGEPAPVSREPMKIRYTNYKGETADRSIVPARVYFGSTQWHPEPQWLLEAFDVDKNEIRTFAFKDIAGVSREPISAEQWLKKEIGPYVRVTINGEHFPESKLAELLEAYAHSLTTQNEEKK